MGGDGGVYAVNRTYLRQCGDKFLREGSGGGGGGDPKEAQAAQTRTCAMSQEPLEEPIVCCELGYMYNKDFVLRTLLSKTLNPAFAHLRGLKDLIEPKLTRNASSSGDGKEGGDIARFMCPVTRLEMNGGHPFCVLRTTGWVLSERAIKEVGMEGLQLEYGPFDEDDVIRLVPSAAERDNLRVRMESRRAKEKAMKKAMKRAAAEAGGGSLSKNADKKEKKKRKIGASASAATSATAATPASKVQRAVEEAVQKQKERSKVYGSIFAQHNPSKNDLFIANR